jgi:hypothetical protein
VKEKYDPCPICNGSHVYPYTYWEYITGIEPRIIYSYIQCEDCRTTSYNTTSTFTWGMVVKDWKKRQTKSIWKKKKLLSKRKHLKRKSL